MSRKKGKDKKDHVNVGKDDGGKSKVSDEPVVTFEDYECSGCVETDFTELCALLGVRKIPSVIVKQPDPPICEEDGTTVTPEVCQKPVSSTSVTSTTCLYVELETEDPISVKIMRIFGWQIYKQIFQVLTRLIPSFGRLQNLEFWQAGLTDQMVISLLNTASLCSNLRCLTLEGNPLPENSFHLLLSEDSPLRFLSLRNNQIEDEGARLIGVALSTPTSANKNLLSLNLSFNRIGDVGAEHIAKGLRLNRALCLLSLANNYIGDTGATQFATILGPFALTHEEVVARRKILLGRGPPPPQEAEPEDAAADRPVSSCSISSMSTSKGGGKSSAKKKDVSKKDDKGGAKKATPKPPKKSLAPPKKGSKLGAKEKQPNEIEEKSDTVHNELVRLVKVVNPLQDEFVQRKDGQLFLSGNTTLASISLAGNRITQRPLDLFLSSLLAQAEGTGLLHLSLERNQFSTDCEAYVKILELMQVRDPLNKPEKEQPEEQDQISPTCTEI